MKRLYLVAGNLKKKGFNKLAQQVFDLSKRIEERDRRKKENEEVLKQMREEERLEEIQRQHRLDKMQLQNPEFSSQLTYPGAHPPSRRIDVHVRYPLFDDAGAAYFDPEESIEETLSVTPEELESLRSEEEIGGLQIISADPQLPKAD